uniref:dipicolinate synthase subunit DpsA n=1 Tax=Roseburia hominis TaxID=301301 RepID=UPI002432AF8D
MNRQTILLISDMRQVYLAEIMTKRGLNVRCLDIRNSGTVKEQLEKLKSFLAEADMLILPIPVTKIPEQKMLNDILNKNLTNDTLVLGGCFSTEQQELLERRDIHYLDFMRDEIVTEENAVATAEGVIAELVNHSPYNIEEAKIIVTGYGCCGRAVAARLKALGGARDGAGKKTGSAQNLPRRMDFMPRILRLDRRKRWGRQCWS